MWIAISTLFFLSSAFSIALAVVCSYLAWGDIVKAKHIDDATQQVAGVAMVAIGALFFAGMAASMAMACLR